VLELIAAQPRHGYELIKAIEEGMNGHYVPSPGVIYPTLTYLEETGLVQSEAQSNKKLYSITDEGRAELEANSESVQNVRARMNEVKSRFGGPPAPELRRAMENLRAALQVRLTKGQLTPESLAVITAAIDRAAGEIERS
jgi:DNA-binding PadR family transcriptional regulator